MREMSQEDFLEILDIRPEGSLENLNLKPEDLLIPKLFKEALLNDKNALAEICWKIHLKLLDVVNKPS